METSQRPDELDPRWPHAHESRDAEPPPADLGRSEVTLVPADRWRYKTPTLRNVALTAPYMHDGSLSSLEEVVRFYNRGGHPHLLLDPMIRPLHLTDAEVAALVAFLESLTGDNIAAIIADADALGTRSGVTGARVVPSGWRMAAFGSDLTGSVRA